MSDKDTIKDALEAFDAIQEAEAKNRRAWVEDVRFARLGEQWPSQVRLQRERDGRPCLTINRMPSFIRQVTNDARMNKPAIRCHPVGDGANQQTAEILDGLIRNIEYSSNADVAYDTALEHAVTGGFGYFRIATQYAHDDTFDQDLVIERINNPLSVFGDHRSTAADSSDWNVAFVTENYSEAEFEKKWGKRTEKASWQSDSHDKGLQWFEEDKVRIAEYWTRDEVPAKLLKLSNGIVLYEDSFLANQDLFDAQGITVIGDRPTKTMKVMQRLMSGAGILETNKWAGRYIPIIPVYGDEVVVEGERTFVSLIRFAKDAQQMLNYWRTASTELVALAPRAPFIGRRGAFNSSPDKWNTANTVNHAYIEYDGPEPPQRQAFAGPPAGALQEAMNASDDMKSVMGIYDASLGARSNETSGRAIMARQHEGDTSTFNFIDNLSRAIKHAGRVLVDMIPHVYNEARIIRVIHEDGTNKNVPINQPIPPSPEDMQDAQEQAEGIARIYDLTAGKYDITCEAGPSFNTKRQESSVQMMEFVRSFPASAPVIGDLIAKNLDWPGADDIADRLKAMLPPPAQGVNSQVQQMQQQMQMMDAHAKQAVQTLRQQLEDKQHQQAVEAEKLSIDRFNAETARIKALTEANAKQVDAQLETMQAVQAMNQPQVLAQ